MIKNQVVKKEQQLSEVAIRERIRAYVPSLIEKAVDIANHGDNDNARISAIKLLLSKCIPDLKSAEKDVQVNIMNAIEKQRQKYNL